MKKTVKIMVLFLIIFALLLLTGSVQANSIQKISMDIFIEDNGDAKITESWECYTNEGTEVYHPYYNLGNSEIKDLTVSEGNRKYTTLSKWNVNGSLSSKANKCGINELTDGVELCWGISSYGSHTYTVKYTITNFVSELTDSQMIYWTLIPHNFSNTIGNVYIKIHCNSTIEDTIDVWGYGNYGGTAYVYEGYIEMQSDGSLASDEYMTVLVKFPLGRFNCNNKLNNNFDYYFQMAEEGTIKYDYGKTQVKENTSILLAAIVIMIIFFSFIIGFFTIILSIGNKIIHFSHGEVASFSDNPIYYKKIPYYRDIPCQKDIFRAYYIAYKYGLVKDKADLLGAIILKWLKDGAIRIEQKETGVIFKRENVVVVLKDTNPTSITEKRERELFNMLYAASRDGYLENKEFEKWCRRSYNKVLTWFDKIIKAQGEILVQEGLIQVEEKVALKIFKNRHYIATEELRVEAEQLAGLKRYLEDYTLINEREALEVHMFEEYLIFAQIMGIAKKVAKQFKDLYPEIIEQSNFVSYDHIVFVHMCSDNGISMARHAQREAIERANNYSSGGGGFSSGGGGGGSFGGGSSGGGGFR